MKMKTRLNFFKKLDLMMNLVVKWDFGGGACGNGGGNRMENLKKTALQEKIIYWQEIIET